MSNRAEVIRLYLRYLEACNRRDWDALGTLVADEVLVNGVTRTRVQYVADIGQTTTVFPDYRWELSRAVVEGERLAVHLLDSGTRVQSFLGAEGDGSRVQTDEFDMYRIVDGLVVEVEGTADNARLSH